jgi:hypothetical protein
MPIGGAKNSGSEAQCASIFRLEKLFWIRRGPGGALGAMKKILSYARGSIVSFLPPRYRPKVDRSAGIVSGIVEIFVADLLLIFRAITWMQSKADAGLPNRGSWLPVHPFLARESLSWLNFG